MQAERRDDRPRLLYLLPALLCFAWMFATTVRTHVLRDRWRRHDLADRYPAGGSSQSLLLVNSGNVPAFAEIRCPAWGEPRPERLLPGQSVTFRVPRRPEVERVLEVGSGDGATRLTMKPDGIVERDAIPIWRRVAQVAAF